MEELAKKALMLGIKCGELNYRVAKNILNIDETTAKTIFDFLVDKGIVIDFDYEDFDMFFIWTQAIDRLFKDKQNRIKIFVELCRCYDEIPYNPKQ